MSEKLSPKSFTLDEDSQAILEKLSEIYSASKSDVIRNLILHADQNSFLEKRKASLRESFAKKNAEVEQLQALARERREQRIAQAKTREQEHLEKIKQREARYQAYLREREGIKHATNSDGEM